MKKKTTIIAIGAVAITALSAFTVLQSTGMSTYTGSPADAADCAGCHGGGSAAVGCTITSSPALGAGNTYQPNTTYTFTITGSGYPKYGFDFEIINSQSTSATSVGDFGTLGAAPSGEAIYAPNSGGWVSL